MWHRVFRRGNPAGDRGLVGERERGECTLASGWAAANSLLFLATTGKRYPAPSLPKLLLRGTCKPRTRQKTRASGEEAEGCGEAGQWRGAWCCLAENIGNMRGEHSGVEPLLGGRQERVQHLGWHFFPAAHECDFCQSFPFVSVWVGLELMTVLSGRHKKHD